jgi:nitrogen-specific signal transduction histidine kinase
VNIFELFKTTKPCGSGLGLPAVQQIVSADNGTIKYTTGRLWDHFRGLFAGAKPGDVSFV